jgi:hypothetical protein
MNKFKAAKYRKKSSGFFLVQLERRQKLSETPCDPCVGSQKKKRQTAEDLTETERREQRKTTAERDIITTHFFSSADFFF